MDNGKNSMKNDCKQLLIVEETKLIEDATSEKIGITTVKEMVSKAVNTL
jgi:hypothetical protein